MSIKIVASGLVCLMLLHAGCKEGGRSAPPTSLQATPTTGTVTSDGEVFDLADFSISVPDDWAAFDMGNIAIDDIAKEFPAERAQQMKALLEQVAAKGIIKLMIYSMNSATDDFADNINFIVETVPGNVGMDKVLANVHRQFSALNVQILKEERRTVGDYTYDTITYQMEPADTVSRGYMLIEGGKLYSITLTTVPPNGQDFFTAAEPLLKTFRPK